MACTSESDLLAELRRQGIVKSSSGGESIEYDPAAIKAAARYVRNEDILNQANGDVRPAFVEIGTRWIK